jgi:hypothetical protein
MKIRIRSKMNLKKVRDLKKIVTTSLEKQRIRHFKLKEKGKGRENF